MEDKKALMDAFNANVAAAEKTAKQYEGSYVAFNGGKLVAHDKDYDTFFKKIKDYSSSKDLFVEYIAAKNEVCIV